jgi:hypothetical protein
MNNYEQMGNTSSTKHYIPGTRKPISLSYMVAKAFTATSVGVEDVELDFDKSDEHSDLTALTNGRKTSTFSGYEESRLMNPF